MNLNEKTVSGKRVLHWSMIDMLERCPAQVENYAKYGPRPPAFVLIEGTVTHQAAAADLREKMERGRLMDMDVLDNLTVQALRSEIEMRGVRLIGPELSAGLKARTQEAETRVRALARCHHVELAPVIQPTGIEKSFLLDIPWASYAIAGTLDVEEIAGLRERKTRAKSAKQADAEKSNQITTYLLYRAASLGRLEGESVNDLVAHFDCLIKTKVPKAQTFETRRTLDDFHKLLARFGVYQKMLEAGIFPPCSEENWKCSPAYCGWADVCRFRRNPLTVAVPELVEE